MAASNRSENRLSHRQMPVWYEGYVRTEGGVEGPVFRRRRAIGAFDAAMALARRIRASVNIYAGDRLAAEIHPDGEWVWF